MSAPQDPAARAYIEWLRTLPRLTGKTLTAIAREIGVATSTLTKPVKLGDTTNWTGRGSTIDKIVTRYRVPPPVFGASSIGLRPPSRGLSEDAVPFLVDRADAVTRAVRELANGRENADPWLIKTRSLELAGYLPGDVVIVDLGRGPEVGDAVCAQINIDWQRGTAETVMRIYERAGASFVLIAATMDQALRAPLPVDDRVAIKGVIVGMVRPPVNGLRI